MNLKTNDYIIIALTIIRIPAILKRVDNSDRISYVNGIYLYIQIKLHSNFSPVSINEFKEKEEFSSHWNCNVFRRCNYWIDNEKNVTIPYSQV